jgi:anaerobic selenocysteine-containing dehydrogenase
MISRRRFLGHCGCCATGLIGGGLLRELSCLGPGAAHAQSIGDLGPVVGPDVDRWTRSACDLCGLAEPVFVGTRGGELVAIKGIPQSRTGFGRLCPRAQAVVKAAGTEDRAVEPLLRRDPATKGTLEGLEPVSWDEALARVADGLRSAREELGPEGIAFLSSDSETCETYHVLTRLARVGLGTDHVDTQARLDALPAYDACEQVFGVPANPGSVEDVDAAQLIVLLGGDVAESHPSLFYRVLDARRKDRARVVLVDARRTLASAVADLHLRPRPGQELAVIHSLAAELLSGPKPEAALVPATNPAPTAAGDVSAWEMWLRGQREAFAPACREPLASTREGKGRRAEIAVELERSGVGGAEIRAFVDAWRETNRAVTLVGPTVLGTPAGAALARAVAQLHRATDRWGDPGRGPLFLPRGGNATGVVAFGMAPGRLPAGRRLMDVGDRQATARAWEVEPEALPERPGQPALEWPALIRNGKLKALLVHRANVAAEMPDALAWRRALTDAFTVVTSTHVPSETTVFADVVLPLALTSGESSGTVMSLDRRCMYLERAAEAPGEARSADQLLLEVARSVLSTEVFTRLFSETISEWDRWRALARETDFEAQGIPGARLRQELDVSWPCAAEEEEGTIRFVRAQAPACRYLPTPAPFGAPATDAERPFLLVTGPLREHQRSRARTGRTAELHYEAPYAQLEMHPNDGAALGIAGGEWVTVSSSNGSATARLWLTDRVVPGIVFLPEHYGFLSDVQGGSAAQKEPEGLAHRLTTGNLVAGVDTPAGLLVPVSIRKARRRDMRQRGV